MVDQNRIRQLNQHIFPNYSGVIVYWMDRDQRVHDNWALLYAQEIAISRQEPVVVVYRYEQNYSVPRSRAQDFSIKGLLEVEAELKKYNIPFIIVSTPIEYFVRQYNVTGIVTDFSPLKPVRTKITNLISDISVPLFEVDAHNIVPCWLASDKMEYTAATFRPKITKLLPNYLIEFPQLQVHKFNISDNVPQNDWEKIIEQNNKSIIFTINKYLPIPGYQAGMARLNDFIAQKLSNYSKFRNNPTLDYQSGLSPYFHFGQISAQRAALSVIADKTVSTELKVDFLDELIVRRELADNFCNYNIEYDSYSGFPDSAQKTLSYHNFDKREYFYNLELFEKAQTHDSLWNAAQNELIKTGKMHGYMRMYWAKKILEWSKSPVDAISIANVLNDRYSLDGIDPNGYTGTAWSIGGLHDKPWFDRPIFGQVRYMSYDGCRSKFDINKYIDKINQL